MAARSRLSSQFVPGRRRPPGFGFRHGEVWGAHVAWSGASEHYAERLADSCGVLGGGELLEAG
ncbi:glycoside hydrolase family 36 N-terminal domain-containing protein [Streptomyces sp. bgisy031]|uniref:glycoside hydrolase family 36 N-terminal domain-containing protein n=1 Tax=Streptomyces sp. bgisy031 TaxID=3413772 RepID=UPI003D74433B